MSSASVRAVILHMLPGYLDAIGVPSETVFRRAGMVPGDAQGPRIVRRAQIHAALAAAARTAGMAEIGLVLGSRADAASLGPVGMALRSGGTVESCLRAQMAMMPGMQSQVELGLRMEGASVAWTHRLMGDGAEAWLLYEGASSFNVRMLRALLGEDWAPLCVSFPHARRGPLTVYEDYFQAPVHFGRHSEARIILPAALLARPVGVGGVRSLHAPDNPDVQSLDDFRLDARALETAVRRIIAERLSEGRIGLPRIAAIMGLAPRTLQRRLKEAGTDVERIVDEVRHASALAGLASGTQSVTALAMALGYSDVAHFNRAFRRWEGRSPTGYRQFGARDLAASA